MKNIISDFKPQVNTNLRVNGCGCCGLNDEVRVTINGITYFYYTDLKRRDAYRSKTAKLKLFVWTNSRFTNRRSSDDEFSLNPDLKVNLYNSCGLNDRKSVVIKGKQYYYYTDIKRRDAYRLAFDKTFSDFERECTKDDSKLIAQRLKEKLNSFQITDYHQKFECGKYTVYNSTPEYLRDNFAIASISIDAEWHNKVLKTFFNKKGYPTQFISKQASIFDSSGRRIHIVLIDDKFPPPSDKVFHFLNEPVIFYYGDIQEFTVPQVIYDLELSFDEDEIPVYMFYSPNDLRVMLQSNALKAMYRGYSTEDKIDRYKDLEKPKSVFTKKRNLQGSFSFKHCLHQTPDVADPIDPHSELKNSEIDPQYSKVKFRLRDLIGAFNSSLDKSFDLVGLANVTKDLVDPKRKSKMDEVAREDMDLFFFYLLGDTMNTPKLWELRVKQINRIINDSLGFDPQFEIDDCPRTSGALVSQVWMKWLEWKHPYILAGVEALAKPHESRHRIFEDFLEQLPRQKENVANGFMMLYKNPTSKERSPILLRDLHKLWDGYDRAKSECLGGIAGMARASIGGFIGHCNDNTMFNAIVFGGRCNNENPLKWDYTDVFDIDLSSCYGSALRTLDYPFGRPYVIDGTLGNDKNLTWKDFNQKYIEGSRLGKFADGECMWQAIVDNPRDKNGKTIPFKAIDQDYFFGKPTVSITSMKKDAVRGFKEVDGDDDHSNSMTASIEKTHVTGSLMLARKEMVNSVVTQHDMLPIVNKIASNKERAEFNKLNVKTASGYLAKDEVLLVEGDDYSTVDEKFYDLMASRKTRGEWQSKSLDDTKTIDLRNHYWVRLPLEEFIGSIIDYRKKLKNLKKKYSSEGDRVKANAYDVEQNACKLFINTLYGCLASPYFPLSNTILANNITSKARFGVWMINKALGTAMSITDGGAYSNNSVRFLDPSLWEGKKPSLSVLSNYEKLNKQRTINTGKLIARFEDFYQRCKNGESKQSHDELDTIATKHINDFWGHWGLKLEFEIEHKPENTCQRMIVYNKSDYLFLDPIKPDKSCSVEDSRITQIVNYGDRHELTDGEVINYTPKVRGAKQNDHPKKLWLFVLANIIKLEQTDINFLYEQLVGVNAYIQSANGKDPRKKQWTNHILPGETLLLETNFNPTTNFLPKYRYTDYKEHERNRTNRKKHLEKRIAQDENYLNDLLAVILSDGMLDIKVMQAVLKHGGDEFVTNVVRPHVHKRSPKAQKRFILKYKKSKTLTPK